MRLLIPTSIFFFLVSVSCLMGESKGPRGPGHDPRPQSGLRTSPKSSSTSRQALWAPKKMEVHLLPDAGLLDGGLRLSWTEIYVPMKRCHIILKGKVGEFSIPVMRSRFPRNIWCNWTIWADPQSHVVIYVHGFIGNDSCEANSDKIVFQGISSVVEHSTVYACSNKTVHVYATQALAVHVVLLAKNYAQGRRYRHFRGKYYIFRDPRADSGRKIRKPHVTKLPVLFQRTSSVPTINNSGPKTLSPGEGLDKKWPSLGPEDYLPVTLIFQSQGLSVEDAEKLWTLGSSMPNLVQPSSLISLTETTADSILATTSLETNEEDLWKTAYFPAPGETTVFYGRWPKNLETSILAWPSVSGEALSSTVISLTSSMVALELSVWSSLKEWERPEKISEDGPAIRSTSVDSNLGSWERTTSWKGESVSLNPSQVVESVSGGDKQLMAQTGVLPRETPSLFWEEPGTGLTAEASLSLEGWLSPIPVTPLSYISSSLLPVAQAKSFQANPLWGTVGISEDTSTSTIKRLAWLSSGLISDEEGVILAAASPSSRGLISPTLSHGFQVTTSEARLYLLPWMASSSPLPESIETISVTHSITSNGVSSLHHVSLTERNLTRTAWSPEGLARVKPTIVPHPTTLATTCLESVPQSTSVIPSLANHREPGISEGTMEIPMLASWLVSELQLSLETVSEARGKADSTLHPFVLQGLLSSPRKSTVAAEQPGSYNPSFLQSSVAVLTSSPTLTGVDLASKSLVSTSWPKTEEIVSSGVIAGPQHMGLSGELLLITSYSRENIGVASLPEGRLDNAFYHFASELVPGFWLSHALGSFPESEFPSGTKAYATPAVSLAPELQTSWAVTSSEETIGDQTKMIIQPSRELTLKEAKPWQSTHSWGQVWRDSIWDLPGASSSFPGVSSGEWTQAAGVPTTPSSLSPWEEGASSLETELPQNYSDVIIFSSFPENGSVLAFQHNPGDIFVKVIIKSEHLKEFLNGDSSSVLRFLIGKIEQEISEKKDYISPQYEEGRQTGMEKKDAVNVFWLHIRSQGVGVPDTLSCQLRTLIKKVLGTHEVEKRYSFLEDVNECEVGLQFCGDRAECVNRVGSYSCHCQKEYEDHDPMQPGMLCVPAPHTGVKLSVNYMDLLVGVAAFTAVLLMLVIGLVWLVAGIHMKNANSLGQNLASQEHLPTAPTFDLKILSKHPPFYSSQPKLRAKFPEGVQDKKTYLHGELQAWVEQSERL